MSFAKRLREAKQRFDQKRAEENQRLSEVEQKRLLVEQEEQLRQHARQRQIDKILAELKSMLESVNEVFLTGQAELNKDDTSCSLVWNEQGAPAYGGFSSRSRISLSVCDLNCARLDYGHERPGLTVDLREADWRRTLEDKLVEVMETGSHWSQREEPNRYEGWVM